MDQTVTIRASVHDTEKTLIISVMLVILVVFVFLRSGRTTFIPSVAVPYRWWAHSASCTCWATAWTIYR